MKAALAGAKGKAWRISGRVGRLGRGKKGRPGRVIWGRGEGKEMTIGG